MSESSNSHFANDRTHPVWEMDEEKHATAADAPMDTPVVHDQTTADEIYSVTSRDLDETYELYKKQDATNINPQEAGRVLRKIDLHVLPLLMVSYMLQYLDKSSINFASVYGLQTGTHLKGQDYSWLSSIFYFGKMQPTSKAGLRGRANGSLTIPGYLFAQYPSGYLLQRLPSGKFIGGSTIGKK
jgi:hypothetical protein